MIRKGRLESSNTVPWIIQKRISIGNVGVRIVNFLAQKSPRNWHPAEHNIQSLLAFRKTGLSQSSQASQLYIASINVQRLKSLDCQTMLGRVG